MIRNRNAGTSLIELLVVIVIFAIGILGIVQLFPAGFQALNTTRNNSVATELIRREMERVKSQAGQLPEAILAVRVIGGGVRSIVADPDRSNYDFSPVGVGIDQNGDILDAANQNLGPWGLGSGSNVIKRVVGEGGPVPAPRNVGSAIGGLMVLQFAPIVYDASYTAFLRVYGNDLITRYGQPFGAGFGRPYEYFVSDENDNGNPSDTLFLPQIPLPANPNDSPFRVSFSYYVDIGGGVYRLRELVDADPAILRANLIPSVNYPGYWVLEIGPLITALGVLGGGETFAGLDDASTAVQRNFEEIPIANAFTNNPYEYKLLDPKLGVLLFNPVGYNYEERRPGGRRVRLQSRVNYDVYDWRVIRDEFRIPQAAPFQQKLALNAIQVKGNKGADALTYNGLGIPIPDGAGGSRDVDVIVQDVDSGAVFLHDPSNPRNPAPPPGTTNDFLDVDPARTAYVVDKSVGLIRFADADPGTVGLQANVFFPGQTVATMVDVTGRKVRVMYRAKGEWAVQVLKAPNRFQIVGDRPAVGQCYVGSSTLYGGQPTRVYFPGQDVGKKVTIGEIYYTNVSGPAVIRDQDFLIISSPADPLGLPYIDIRSIDAGALAFDFSNNFAVRRVKGASVTVRALWNPSTFFLTNDSAENLRRFEVWNRSWRKVTTDTFLEKGDN